MKNPIKIENLKGNLGNKPELGKTVNGDTFAGVTLYYQSVTNSEEHPTEAEPIKFRLGFFGDLADPAYQKLNKGDFIQITAGDLFIDKTIDDETEAEIYSFLVSVKDYRILSQKTEEEDNHTASFQKTNRGHGQYKNNKRPKSANNSNYEKPQYRNNKEAKKIAARSKSY